MAPSRKDSTSPAGRKKSISKSKRVVDTRKMTVGNETCTSKKFHVLICGDCDVADVYHHMETEIPDGSKFLIFGETDKRYGGFKKGRMGEYFSVDFDAKGRYYLKDRVDWEDGIEMISDDGYVAVYMNHRDLVGTKGYTFQEVRI